MVRSIKLTTTYDFTIEKVWAALIDPEAMSEWLMPCNLRPEIGYRFQFRTKPYPGFNGIVECQVLELEAPHLLSFSWSGGSLKETKVVFRLSADGEKTRLDFEHGGFEGLLNGIIVRKILANGWKKKILTVALPKYLSK